MKHGVQHNRDGIDNTHTEQCKTTPKQYSYPAMQNNPITLENVELKHMHASQKWLTYI